MNGMPVDQVISQMPGCRKYFFSALGWSVGLLVLLDPFLPIRETILATLAIVASAVILAETSRWNNADAVFRGMAVSFGALAVGCLAVEALFRTLLLQDMVPKTDLEFEELISSGWPHSISHEKEANHYRIIGLEDSFGLSNGFNNHLYILEFLCRGKGASVELANFAVGGYSPTDELKVLSRFGARYKPNLVIEGFYVGNDFIAPIDDFHMFRGVPVDRLFGWEAYRPSNFLFVQWLVKYQACLQNQALRKQEIDAGGPSGFLSHPFFLKRLQAGLENCRKANDLRPRWGKVLPILDEIHNQIEHMGASHVLVIHPDQVQVNETLRDEAMEGLGLVPADFDLDLPQRFLESFCQERGILYVDLLPLLRHRKDGSSLYGSRDVHYSKKGDEIVGRALFEFLRDNFNVSAGAAPQVD